MAGFFHNLLMVVGVNCPFKNQASRPKALHIEYKKIHNRKYNSLTLVWRKQTDEGGNAL